MSELVKEGLFSSSELTATPGVDQARRDFLVRVTTDETSSSHYYLGNTTDIQAKIFGWASLMLQDLEQLREVVQWQHKVIDYNSVYQAFLMDQLSDDEFEAEAQKYVYEPVVIAPEDLAPKIQRVYELTGIPYTPSDVSDLFQCDHDDAIKAISLVRRGHPELGYMLPEDDR